MKSTITFTIAAVASLFVIDAIQANRVSEKSRADAYYAARVKALDEFRSAAVAYDLAAHSAYTDLYQWGSKQKTSAMLKYEQEAYPKWVLSAETIAHLFPGTLPKVQKLTSTAVSRHMVYDVLVDKRLDGTEMTPVDPWATRGAFNELSKAMLSERAALVAELQSSLFPPLSSK